ncbi:Na+/H+ antiporter NhaA [Ancylomarina sp. 16SWW S1-10-2]|uniref:Na+/H+ antiporter NhaA n=1 Tax=Ancylomarina sp. 16SWW S1-10-2 TaxID=2499681 RepID=UPI0012AD64CB|nr:Na+/H+ antiporter NhaA [Ancylomarina sp. 16SWW S1-10-2]MRT92947.1 Na+/H+ antiporter NhaA [Ancylomarina sp. 16SWW S1-10-2]
MIQFFKRKRLFDRIKDPLADFVRLEAFGGIVLMVFTVLALVIANSYMGEDFLAYWENYFGLHFGDWQLSKTLIHWINDGLMAIFFFVVGLEIKREMLTGGLSSIKNASLPIFAAVGGMLVPALIYVYFNQTGSGTHGWGVPMATDIAFALGILILLGNRIPVSLKLLLTSIAIVDDIGAVIVIALFYTSEIDWMYLIYGGGIYALLWGLNLLKVRIIPVYLFLGCILWYVLLKSGVHATLAGILLALTIPARASCEVFEFIKSGTSLLSQMGKIPTESTVAETDKHIQSSVETIKENCQEVISPLQRLEHALHPFVIYFIVPLFAFANAGVIIDHQLLGEVLEPISIGIILGLFLGKPIGIYLFAWAGVRLGFARKPVDVYWSQILGIGFLGGIGFTMSFFVSQLAFTDPSVLSLAKLAVLIASVLSGLIGFLILKSFSHDPK